MEAITHKNEQENEKRGKIISTVIHVLILLLAFYPFMSYMDPPPGQEGILIAFGEPDAGGGFPEEGEPEEAPEQAAEEMQEVEEAEAEETAPAEEVTPTPVPDPKPDVKTTDADEIALKKKQAEAKKKKQEADKKKREEDAKKAAEAAKKKAAAEAKAKAEAEAKAKADALQAKKDKIGGFGGNKPGNGPGDKPGNAGDANESNIGSDFGIGGDLGGRGVKSRPEKPTNPDQQKGTVTVYLCVDENGIVKDARFQSRGSTINQGRAVENAIANARKYSFSVKKGIPPQCGTIQYIFEVE